MSHTRITAVDLVFILAVAAACTLAGAKTCREIGDHAADLPRDLADAGKPSQMTLAIPWHGPGTFSYQTDSIERMRSCSHASILSRTSARTAGDMPCAAPSAELTASAA